MKSIPRTLVVALSLGTALSLSPIASQAQDGSSAVDANGTPVGMAEGGTAGGPEIVGTDGLIRYADSDEMWRTLSSKWDALGEKASERWSEIDAEALMETNGDEAALVSLVSERYEIPEEQAQQEVTAWATSVDDAM